MMGPVFRSRRGRLALFPPRAVRALRLGYVHLLLPSPTLQRAALGPDALVRSAPRAGFYAVVTRGLLACRRWGVWYDGLFLARALLSEVLLWMAPPGSPTTEDTHGILRIETKRNTTRMSTTMSTTTWGPLVPTTTTTTYDI